MAPNLPAFLAPSVLSRVRNLHIPSSDWHRRDARSPTLRSGCDWIAPGTVGGFGLGTEDESRGKESAPGPWEC